MRRDVLEHAVEKIAQDLVDSGMIAMLRAGMENIQVNRDKEKLIWMDIGIITNYINRVSLYNNTEKYVLNVMNLSELSDSSAWQEQLNEPDRSFLYRFHTSTRFTVDYLPKIASLLKRDYSKDEKDSPYINDDVSLQTIILSDEGDSLSSPTRLVELLESVQQLYAALAEIEGIQSSTLAVVGMDSGSEKSFDFLGIARLVHEMRELFAFIYNTVAFHKQNVTTKNLQVAGETLTVVAKLAKLEQTKVITAEDSLRLRHAIFSGLEKFAATGAYTPEMGETHRSPSLLMKPQQRMLTGPVENLVRDSKEKDLNEDKYENDIHEKDSEQNNEEFTKEQIEEALRLLRASKESKSNQVASKPSSRRKKSTEIS